MENKINTKSNFIQFHIKLPEYSLSGQNWTLLPSCVSGATTT